MKLSVRNVNRGSGQPETGLQRMSYRLLNSYAVLLSLSCAMAVVTFALFTQRTVDAANPSSASLGPNSTSVSWQGTANLCSQGNKPEPWASSGMDGGDSNGSPLRGWDRGGLGEAILDPRPLQQ